jgi:hypothetical protein
LRHSEHRVQQLQYIALSQKPETVTIPSPLPVAGLFQPGKFQFGHSTQDYQNIAAAVCGNSCHAGIGFAAIVGFYGNCRDHF